MNRYIYISFLSFILCQNDITTLEIPYYYNNENNSIDFRDFINDYNGNYKIELISLNDLVFERTKKVFIEQCDLIFNLSNNLSIINISRCDNLLKFEGVNHLDNDNSTININHPKYKILNCTFTFWVTGSFNVIDHDDEKNNGILKEYYDNGNLKLYYNFKNGKKDGIQKKWYENNQLEMIYHYSTGKLDGVQKKWHKNGSLKGEWFYKNDKLHGIIKEWYLNGNLKFSKKYDEGILIEILENYTTDSKSFD